MKVGVRVGGVGWDEGEGGLGRGGERSGVMRRDRLGWSKVGAVLWGGSMGATPYAPIGVFCVVCVVCYADSPWHTTQHIIGSPHRSWWRMCQRPIVAREVR